MTHARRFPWVKLLALWVALSVEPMLVRKRSTWVPLKAVVGLLLATRSPTEFAIAATSPSVRTLERSIRGRS